MSKPSLVAHRIRLWPATWIAAVALLGALLEILWPDGLYAEGRPTRLLIEAQGWPSLITTLATTAVRVWVSLATLVPLVGVGTACGALVLAALNWRRMGQPHQYVMYLLLALVVATLPRAKLFGEGIYFGHWMVALAHVIVAVHLYRRQRSDIAAFRKHAPGPIAVASPISGVLIALAGSVAQSALSYLGIALAVQANLFFAGRL